MRENPQNLHLPLPDVDPSDIHTLQPTPLTTLNGNVIVSRTFTHLRNKVPIGYNVMPQIHPQNCPPLGRSSPPSNVVSLEVNSKSLSQSIRFIDLVTR